MLLITTQLANAGVVLTPTLYNYNVVSYCLNKKPDLSRALRLLKIDQATHLMIMRFARSFRISDTFHQMLNFNRCLFSHFKYHGCH
jgi:hypothetical protein